MKWVLVDISWLAYRALHAVGELEHEDIPTGIIFGFFHQLRQVCLDNRVRSNRVLIFCDSRSSIRQREYPEYKQKRKEKRTDEEVQRIKSMRRQMDLLSSRILQKIGFPVYFQEGLESDDLIAFAAQLLTEQKREAVIVTSDGDLLQCITPYVNWFDPQRNRYYDEDSFSAEKGLPPSKWSEVKALGGCSSDCVKGVPGVGEGTAIKYLLGDLPPRYKAHESIISPSGRKTLKRNRRLIVLPHEATEPIVVRKPRFRPSVFFKYCERYGLLSILREKKAWTSFLTGSLFKTRMRGLRARSR